MDRRSFCLMTGAAAMTGLVPEKGTAARGAAAEQDSRARAVRRRPDARAFGPLPGLSSGLWRKPTF